jgi:hypothetical protein
MKDNNKKIIQFFHSGEEHTKSTGIKWNDGSHKRKFMAINGKYVSKKLEAVKTDNLCFWGEWEAPAKLIKSINTSNDKLPKNIFSPFYTPEIGRVNTDPFVFGNEFYYMICKQAHYPSLREIPIGSIILFGSNKKKKFVLDTLFVVKDYEEYDIQDIYSLSKKYNDIFFNVSLKPLTENLKYAEKKEIKESSCGMCIPIKGDDVDDYKPTKELKKYKIYKAVMFDEKEQFNGMYSFAPCIAGERGKGGFGRPEIELPNVISNEQNQGIKISKTDSIKMYWENIKDQVLNNEQDLDLMIGNDLPVRYNR